MINPKDKALELIEKFTEPTKVPNIKGILVVDIDAAKQCALICVDEIITASPSAPILSDNGSFVGDIEESTKWWETIKKEIENLHM